MGLIVQAPYPTLLQLNTALPYSLGEHWRQYSRAGWLLLGAA
jgi:hypothetical protein